MGKPVSMTGFGRGEAKNKGYTWTVEIRTVNHRYLDVSIKSARRFMGWEEKIKKEVSVFHIRGRIDVYVGFSDDGVETSRLKTDLSLAREYLSCLQEITDRLSLPGEPDLAMLSAYRDIITPREDESGGQELEEYWPVFREALIEALKVCQHMRQSEGEMLQQDISARLAGFEKKLDSIEQSLSGIIEMRERSLKERLDKLLDGVDIDPLRFAQEAAILVDKTDVSEELVRLRSHIEQFRKFLGLDEPVGRRLDFLTQEFLREVNTIASKISNADTAHVTVEMKNDLEKIREQVQNLE